MSSWFNPVTEKRTSPIAERGLFARDAIRAGEIVAVKGGAVMDTAAFMRIQSTVSPAEIQIEDDLYIAPAQPKRSKQISSASITPAIRMSAFAVRSRSWRCGISPRAPS
jgi:hypothetical protein